MTNLNAAPAIFHPGLQKRSDIGVAMQNPAVRPWKASLVWGIVDEILASSPGGGAAEAEQVFAKWADFKGRIEELGLPKDHAEPPLLDVGSPRTWDYSAPGSTWLTLAQGKQLQALLNLKPSQLIQVILQAVNVWLLDNPQATQADCEAWVRSMWEGEGKTYWESLVPAPVVKEKAEKQKKKRRLSAEKGSA